LLYQIMDSHAQLEPALDARRTSRFLESAALAWLAGTVDRLARGTSIRLGIASTYFRIRLGRSSRPGSRPTCYFSPEVSVISCKLSRPSPSVLSSWRNRSAIQSTAGVGFGRLWLGGRLCLWVVLDPNRSNQRIQRGDCACAAEDPATAQGQEQEGPSGLPRPQSSMSHTGRLHFAILTFSAAVRPNLTAILPSTTIEAKSSSSLPAPLFLIDRRVKTFAITSARTIVGGASQSRKKPTRQDWEKTTK